MNNSTKFNRLSSHNFECLVNIKRAPPSAAFSAPLYFCSPQVRPWLSPFFITTLNRKAIYDYVALFHFVPRKLLFEFPMQGAILQGLIFALLLSVVEKRATHFEFNYFFALYLFVLCIFHTKIEITNNISSRKKRARRPNRIYRSL